VTSLNADHHGWSHRQEALVKTVQMTLDEELVVRVDRAVRKLGTTRSAFARDALRAALARLRDDELERKQRAGYERHPVKEGEFDAWVDEQSWPD
jgi:Arc/MetJ-type ribon-helix-helix transcriptional regulator